MGKIIRKFPIWFPIVLYVISPNQETLKKQIISTVLAVSDFDLAYDLYRVYGEVCINVFWNYASS